MKSMFWVIPGNSLVENHSSLFFPQLIVHKASIKILLENIFGEFVGQRDHIIARKQ